MALEITRPETEARIQRYLQSGQFHDLDELLAKALDALPEPEAAKAAPPERRTGQLLIDACAKASRKNKLVIWAWVKCDSSIRHGTPPFPDRLAPNLRR